MSWKPTERVQVKNSNWTGDVGVTNFQSQAASWSIPKWDHYLLNEHHSVLKQTWKVLLSKYHWSHHQWDILTQTTQGQWHILTNCLGLNQLSRAGSRDAMGFIITSWCVHMYVHWLHVRCSKLFSTTGMCIIYAGYWVDVQASSLDSICLFGGQQLSVRATYPFPIFSYI